MSNPPTSYRLSPETRRVLQEQAKRFKVSETRVLEFMVNEFTSSTPEERQIQRQQKAQALNAFLREKPDATVRQTWNAGFKAGWRLFQIRKKDHLFKSSD